jgi:hypothetical protein
MEIITLTPAWFFIVCTLAAAAISWLLYRKSFFENKTLTWVLRFLRFVGYFLVIVLLLSPVIRVKTHRELKPIIAVYNDKSLSLSASKPDSFLSNLQTKFNDLEDYFTIKYFDFAENVVQKGDSSLNITRTSLAAPFDHINETLEGQNIAATIIASDGIQNQGINPLFKKLNKPVPVFTIGRGDTIQYPDVWVSGIESNSVVFFENEFEIQANIRAEGIKQNAIQVQLFENGVPGQTKIWNRNNPGDNFTTLTFNILPHKPGLHRFEVKIAALSSETNTKNNAKGVYVQVTDTRRKIAILAHSAHPDIAAISRCLETNTQYEVKKFERKNYPNPAEFDIAICHGFPYNNEEINWLRKRVEIKKSVFVILSSQSNLRLFNGLEFGFDPAAGGGINDVQGTLNANFNDFIIESNLETEISNWPPLSVSTGRYRTSAGFTSVLYQKIGNIQTTMPLLGFTELNAGKQAWCMGEGIWKWRMADYQHNQSSKNFDDLMAKIIQVLGAGDVKQKFKVFLENPEMNINENAQIFAEYLNESGNLDNRAECEISIQGDNGIKHNLKFAKTGNRYYLQLGALPAGNYTYSAKHLQGNEMVNGIFSVSNLPVELESTVANHSLLRNLSKANNGLFFPEQEVQNLVEYLKNTAHRKNVISTVFKITELIHWKWFFGIIILIFTIEWFLRKWAGGY